MSRIIAFAFGMRVVLLHAHGAAGAVYAGPQIVTHAQELLKREWGAGDANAETPEKSTESHPN